MHATTQQDISTLLCLFCRYIYNLQQQQQQDHRTQLTELRMNLNLSTTAGSTATQTTLLFLPQHICVHPPLKMLVGGKRKEYKRHQSLLSQCSQTLNCPKVKPVCGVSPSLRLNSVWEGSPRFCGECIWSLLRRGTLIGWRELVAFRNKIGFGSWSES